MPDHNELPPLKSSGSTHLSRRAFLASAALTGAVASVRPGKGDERRAEQAEPAAESDEDAIFLADLGQCQPSSALAKRLKRGTWRAIPYESPSFSGTMLVAVEESQAPDVTYHIGREGWHRIYIGIYRKPFEEPKEVQVKLTDDPAYTSLAGLPGMSDHQENWIDDIYWTTADLTGQAVIFRQIVRPEIRHAWVGYIKLVPLSDEEVRALQQDRSRDDTRRLFVHTDAHYSNVAGSTQELLNELEPLRHTDVSRVYWEAAGGDRVLYFSKIGRDFASAFDLDGDEAAFARPIDREWAETWAAYRRNAVDPLRVAAEFAHEIGLELHASYRPAGFAYPPPHDDYRGSFFEKHPEWACVARDGSKLPRISYAYPEVRRYVISLFEEMAAYPIAGVCVLYNRRPPLVAYEPPLVDGFKSRHGKDPRKLDEHDPGWLAYRSVALTAFMRELRTSMDEAAQRHKREKRLEISAVVFREDENVLHGMDLKTWIDEGLVDTIIPYSSSIRLNSFLPSWVEPADIEYFVSLVKGTNCHLAPNLLPRSLTAEEYHRKAHLLYTAGVENFFFWDGTSRVRKVPRLGHREEVAAWTAAGEPPIVPTAVKLQRLGSWDVSIETPG